MSKSSISVTALVILAAAITAAILVHYVESRRKVEAEQAVAAQQAKKASTKLSTRSMTKLVEARETKPKPSGQKSAGLADAMRKIEQDLQGEDAEAKERQARAKMFEDMIRRGGYSPERGTPSAQGSVNAPTQAEKPQP